MVAVKSMKASLKLSFLFAYLRPVYGPKLDANVSNIHPRIVPSLIKRVSHRRHDSPTIDDDRQSYGSADLTSFVIYLG